MQRELPRASLISAAADFPSPRRGGSQRMGVPAPCLAWDPSTRPCPHPLPHDAHPPSQMQTLNKLLQSTPHSSTDPPPQLVSLN